MQIYVSKLTIIGSDNGLPPARHQAINQCWNIANWTARNKLKFSTEFSIFIQENAFENVVCEMASILSRLQCAKTVCLLKIIRRHRVSHRARKFWIIIGSGNGLASVRHQAITWVNTETSGTYSNEIWIKMQHFSWRKCILRYRMLKVGHLVPTSMH